MITKNKSASLGDISKLIPGAAKGVYSSGKGNTDETAFLLKGINIDHQGGLNQNDLEEISIKNKNQADRYLLKGNDVVLMARGSAIRTAFVSTETATKPIIASANFIIIRPNIKILRGEVVSAFLNSILGQKLLSNMSTNAVINHIPLSMLKNMEIPVPDEQCQNQIAELFHAARKAYFATLSLAEQQKTASGAMILSYFGKAA